MATIDRDDGFVDVEERFWLLREGVARAHVLDGVHRTINDNHSLEVKLVRVTFKTDKF